MRTSSTIAETRVALAGAPRPRGFVPTMGALHEGHAALIRRCRQECASVAVSIFVNPLQFDERADLEAYPRTPDADLALCRGLGVDLVFTPSPEELYPPGSSVRVDPGPLGARYEGAVRPGHFAGVATVVTKLFHVVAPDRAYFGRKDAQQLAIVRRLARDLDFPLEVVGCDTVRAGDGLALSSRNARLDAGSRERAAGIARGLRRARDAWAAGERDAARLVALARDPELAYEYLEAVEPDDFGPARPGGSCLLVAAVRFPGVRLIDNVLLEP